MHHLNPKINNIRYNLLMKKIILLTLCTLSAFAQTLEYDSIKEAYNGIQKGKPLKLNTYTYIVGSKPLYKKNTLEIYAVVNREKSPRKYLDKEALKQSLKEKTLYSTCKSFYKNMPHNFKMKMNYIYKDKKSKKIFTQVLVTQEVCDDML